MKTEIVHFQLAQPEWLILLIIPLWLLWLSGRRGAGLRIPGRELRERFVFWHTRHTRIAALLQGTRGPVYKSGISIRNFGLAVVFGLFAFALSRPEWVGKQLPEPPHERDIVFVVDTSLNMIHRDYLLNEQRIDRMTLLRGIIGRFIENLHGERLSIVVYGDRPYTLVPFTRDHQLVRHMLSKIRVGLAGRTNAMGDALALAIRETELTPDQKRVLILFTDGTRPAGRIAPEAATELARQHGIRIYTIGIGAGTVEASEKKVSGLIYDTVNIQRLRNIAEHTGGRFYWAGDTGKLHEVIRDIDQLERPARKPEPRFQRYPLYQWPLFAALLLLALLQLSHTRSGRHE